MIKMLQRAYDFHQRDAMKREEYRKGKKEKEERSEE